MVWCRRALIRSRLIRGIRDAFKQYLNTKLREFASDLRDRHTAGTSLDELRGDGFFDCDTVRVDQLFGTEFTFDKAKGFGFANIFGRPEDVFIHIEILRHSGFADLASGEAVGRRVIEGRRGRLAVQVLSWESALKSRSGLE